MTDPMTGASLKVEIAYQRARTNAILARARARLAELGAETATRPRRSDRDFVQKVIGIWKRKPPRTGTSTLHLPSGRTLTYDHAAGKVVTKP